MTAPNPSPPKAPLPGVDDFSFVLGGPLFQLLRRLGLAGDALQLLRRRILVIAALSWIPLLVLSVAEGRAFGGEVMVPFLLDIEPQVRFLVVVPLLIVAEPVVHGRIRYVARQFLDRDLIRISDRPRFQAIVESAIRLRNSVPAELILAAVVYGVGIMVVWRRYTALGASTWYGIPGPDGVRLTLAGMWYAFVSLPLAQFLLLRWYYRIFIWIRFVWQTAGLDLRLVPTHPDRVGGLGFLGLTPYAFTPLAVAHGVLLSAWIANRIFLNQGALADFKVEIVALAVWLLLLVLSPLLFFILQLSDAAQKGEREYGPLAERYALAFEDKWVGAESPTAPPLGSRDIQSLGDMVTVYSVVHTMRLAPISRMAVIQLLVATLAPLAPLLLTLMPLGELVKRLASMLL